MSGGGGGGDQTTKTEPWDAAKPYLKDIMAHGRGMFQSVPNNPYAGNRVAQWNQADLRGQNYLQNYASGMQPYINQAQNTSSFLQNPGQMLNVAQNPYVRGNVQSAQRQVMDNFNSSILPQLQSDYRRAQPFAGSREQMGAGLAAGEAAKAMGDIGSRMYGQAYGQNLQAMGQAQGQAANMARLGMLPGEMMSKVGLAQRERDQQRINARMQYHKELQQAPWDQLSRYQGAVQGMGSMGRTSSAEQPGGSPIGGALGGALAGATLFGEGGALAGGAIGGPAGIALGAGLGLLGGML